MKKSILLFIMLAFTSIIAAQINFDHLFNSLEIASSDPLLDGINTPLIVLMPTDSVYKMEQSKLEPFEDKFVLIDKREKFIKRITDHYVLQNYERSKHKIAYSLIKNSQAKNENLCPFEKLYIVYNIDKKKCKIEMSDLAAKEQKRRL